MSIIDVTNHAEPIGDQLENSKPIMGHVATSGFLTTTSSFPMVTLGKPRPASIPVDQCPPLLQKRIEEFGIVMPPQAAITDRVMVWPLPEKAEAKVGSIHLAPTTTKKHAAQLGVIVRMGLRATEELYSQGIELGHIVLTAKFTPTSWEYTNEGKVGSIMLMRSGDIQASLDLQQLFNTGLFWPTRDVETGRVELYDRERFDPVQSDDQG